MLSLLVAAALAQAPTIHLPPIFSDNMVVQRDTTVPFFGTAAPGTPISISFNGHTASTRARGDGTWQMNLRPMKAGGPYSATIVGDGTVVLRNVMIGDVWLCSGQSNMELHVGEANESQLAQAEADPAVRMFTVDHESSERMSSEVKGNWAVAKPDTVIGFSAVGYWYGSELHKRLGVPIGLIHSSWGGTPAEAWTSRSALLENPALAPMVKNYLSSLKDFPTRKAAYDRNHAAWKAAVYHEDQGNDGYSLGYADPFRDTSTWKKVTLPNLLEVTEERQMDGAVWYRKEVDLPASWAGKHVNVSLGTIDDFDTTYFNGRRIGEIDEKTQYWYAVDRVYPVPPALVHAGRNVVSVRVFDQFGRGGFTGGAPTMKIQVADLSEPAITLAGEWVSRIERYIEPATEAVVKSEPAVPFGPGHPWVPGGLFNGMVLPLVPYAIRGVIWYQGETNADRAYQYRELFPALIDSWRKIWAKNDLPFYFVQLPNYTARLEHPDESSWAELREAQAMALKLPKTDMAVTIDLGEANDIHPKSKREVGHRLALIALAREYGEAGITNGPIMKTVKFEEGIAKIEFSANGPLKVSDGGPVGGFTIAGEDHKFYFGEAKIEGNTVVVSCQYVTKPVSIRYAWANNPYVNLTDDTGLPTTPFRTDDWPGITQPKK